MRVIVYGMGAIGGVVAAALYTAGCDVVGIARGAMLAAVQSKGLTLHHHGGPSRAAVPCVAHPSEIDFTKDDMILLTMKSQDTYAALEALRKAGVRVQPIFCCQNGVANERAALRVFPNVYGATVMMPASVVEPGVVVTHVQPKHGIFDIGRYPHGSDDGDAALAAMLEAANIATFRDARVMESKYGKLIMNQMNIVQAAVGAEADMSALRDLLRAEAAAVLKGAGIEWKEVAERDPRRADHIQRAEIPGIPRSGGSTLQSLARGAGSIETDYLNGEIVLIARLTGQSAPLNAALQDLGAHLLEIGAEPGAMSPEAVMDWVKRAK